MVGGALEFLFLLTVVTLLVVDGGSCSHHGVVQSGGYAVVPTSCRDVGGGVGRREASGSIAT